MSEWIKSKTQLPESGERVLIWRACVGWPKGVYHLGCWDEDEQGWIVGDAFYGDVGCISDWMPLPDPPKGE